MLMRKTTLLISLLFFLSTHLYSQPVTWDSSTSYSTGALVIVGTSTYIATKSVPANNTPPNTTYWTDLSVAATALNVPVEDVPTLSTDTILASLPGSAPDANSTSGGTTSVSLANLSTRGYVGTGDSQMIAGFVVSGSGSTTATIRALGPTIAAAPFNVSGTISNPVLTIYDGSGNIVTTNDNFADHSSAAAVAASGKNNINSLEPAVQISVTPGNYSAVVSGAAGSTGVAIVEVYVDGK